MTATAQFWDDIAEKYSRRPLANPDATARKLDIVRSLMRPSDTVLDIGCGTGTIALELAPSAGVVHGLDISSEMIKIARDKTEQQNATNVEFHVGTVAEGLQRFEAESLDGICAFNILHLVDDWRGTLDEVFARLKPGGFFVSSTPCLGDTWFPFRPIIAVMRWFGKAPEHVELLRAGQLVDAVGAAGFTDVSQPDVGAGKTTAFVVSRRP